MHQALPDGHPIFSYFLYLLPGLRLSMYHAWERIIAVDDIIHMMCMWIRLILGCKLTKFNHVIWRHNATASQIFLLDIFKCRYLSVYPITYLSSLLMASSDMTVCFVPSKTPFRDMTYKLTLNSLHKILANSHCFNISICQYFV